MAIDLYVPPKFWLTKPGIVRAANLDSIPHWSKIIREARRLSRERAELSFEPPVPPPVGGAVASITKTHSASQVANAAAFTFNSVALGADDPTRAILIGIASETSPTVSGVTLAAAGMSNVVSLLNGSSQEGAQLYIISSASGTGVQVIVSYSGGATTREVSIVVWSLIGYSTTAHATHTDEANSTSADIILSLNVPAGGAVVATASVRSNNAQTHTWTGVDEDLDHPVTALDFYHSAGSKLYASAQTPLAINCNPSDTAFRAPVGVAASFAPL